MSAPTDVPVLARRIASLEESAEYLGICVRHVQNLVKAGRIPSLKIGARRFIPFAALDAFIDARLAEGGLVVTDVLMLAEIRELAASGDARLIRLRHDISVREMADAIGVSQPTLSRWEHGHIRPRGAGAARWLRHLNDLRGREEARP